MTTPPREPHAYTVERPRTGLFELGPYRTLPEYVDELERLAALGGKSVTLATYGESVQGKPLYKVTVDPPGATRRNPPEVLVAALIHGCEFVGGEVCLAVMRRLIEDADTVPWVQALRTRARIVFAPMLNPDAYAKNTTLIKSRRWAWVRKNLNRTDLNRNFPYGPNAKSWHPLSGSRFKWHQSYMGPHPLSEPETRFFAEMIGEHTFAASFSYHSFGGWFLFPCGYSKKRPADFDKFLDIGLTFREHQRHVPYRIRQSIQMYPTIGDLDDWLYEEHGILPFTIEVSRASHLLPVRWLNAFWWMNPINKDYWIANDCDASVRAIARALDVAGST